MRYTPLLMTLALLSCEASTDPAPERVTPQRRCHMNYDAYAPHLTHALYDSLLEDPRPFVVSWVVEPEVLFGTTLTFRRPWAEDHEALTLTLSSVEEAVWETGCRDPRRRLAVTLTLSFEGEVLERFSGVFSTTPNGHLLEGEFGKPEPPELSALEPGECSEGPFKLALEFEGGEIVQAALKLAMDCLINDGFTMVGGLTTLAILSEVEPTNGPLELP